MEKRSKRKIIFYISLLLPLTAFLILFLEVISLYSLRNDDLWVLEYMGKTSFVDDFRFWWQHNNGRFSSAFFQLLIFRLPESCIVLFSSIITLTLCSLSVFSLTKSILLRAWIQNNNKILFSSSLIICIYIISPDMLEVFFWPSAIFVHGWSVPALIFILAWLIHPKNSITRTAIAFISVVFISGSSETASFFLMTILLYAVYKKHYLRKQALFFIIILISGLAIHYFAPASLSRSELLIQSAPVSYIKAILTSIKQNMIHGVISFILALVIISPAIHLLSNKTIHKKNMLQLLKFTAIISILYTFYVVFLMRDREPLRAAQPAFMLLIPLAIAINLKLKIYKISLIYRSIFSFAVLIISSIYYYQILIQ